MDSRSQQHIGQYLLQQQIGQGGMAAVYRAEHPTLKRPVAIKMLLGHLTANSDMLMRFEREAQTVARLRHPHIVSVYDFGIQYDTAYMVMEYIGGTLADWLQEATKLDVNAALRMIVQIADALDYAHQQGIVHRDLKPANIMFTDHTYQHAILTDFGIVRVLGDGHTTADGNLIGTPAYMSPEVVNGDTATAASDMYALGIVWYQVLTGKLPFSGATAVATMLQQVRAPLPDLAPLNLPPNLERLLARLLEKDPNQRPNASALRQYFGATLTAINVGSSTSLADQTLLMFDNATPNSTQRLVGSLPLSFDAQRNFVGRSSERATLRAALDRHERVITVVGKSGIGKTALVSKVLADVLASDAALDGMVVVSARPGDDQVLQLTLDDVMSHFQTLIPTADLAPNQQEAALQQAQRLLRATRNGRYILFLDNIEPMQDEDHTVTEPGIAALLENTIEQGSLSVLITSQLPIRLKGVGKSAQVTLLALDSGLSADDSLQFLHFLWAGAHHPADDDLRRLISQVDGHPRALEAAADWLRENPLNTLDDLLAEIAQQHGDVVAQLVGKSLNNLPSDLQRILAAIAIFEGSTTIPAVEHVIAPFVAGALREQLNRLVLRRFVRFDPTTRTLDLHTLDRTYSRATLPPTSDDESMYGRYALLRRAAAYFAGIRKPEDEWQTYADVLPQLTEFDLRVALSEYDAAASVVLKLFRYLLMWGYLRQLASMYERLQGHVHDNSLLPHTIGDLGLLYVLLGRSHDGIAPLERAASLARNAADHQLAARYLGNLGIAHRNLGDLPSTIQYFQYV